MSTKSKMLAAAFCLALVAGLSPAAAFAATATSATPAAPANEGAIAAGSLSTQADSSWSWGGGVSYKLSGGTLTLAPTSSGVGDCIIAPKKCTGVETFDGGRFMGWGTFYNNSNLEAPPWYSNHASIKKVVIKPGITAIGNCAFGGLENLDEVTIPSTVTTIGENAFTGCKVTSITLPEGVKYIGRWAFWGCEFKSITFPKSLKLISHWICSPIDGGVKTITFLGDAPQILSRMDEPFVDVIKATAYYPANNSTWTAKVRKNMGGQLRWRARNADGSVRKVALRKCSVSLSSSSRIFTGHAHKPGVTIEDLNATLVAGKDYKVAYAKNRNAGTAKVKITGKGDYTGTVTKSFTIAKAANPMKLSGKTISVKAKTLKKKSVKFAARKAVAVTKAKGKYSFKKTSGNKKIAVASTGKVTVKKGLKRGTYKVKVKVTAKGNANYKGISKTVAFKVKVK